MKLKPILQTALIAAVAIGAANAAQPRVEVHADFRGKSQRELEQHASRQKHMIDHPTPAMVAAALPRLAGSANTMEIIAVAEGTMAPAAYLASAKARTIAHLDAWIDDLLGANTPFFVAGVANVTAPSPFVNANRGNGGGWGGRVPVAFVATARPTTLDRDDVKAALAAHVNAITLAELQAIEPTFVRPANGAIETLSNFNATFKRALDREIGDWVDTLLGANAVMLHATVANTAGGVPTVTGAATAGNRPATRYRDDFFVALQDMLGKTY